MDATLNSNAKIGSAEGNPNEVYLTYSNNPNYTGTGDNTPTGTTPKDKVIVFTYELDTTKVDGTTKAKLSGAEFELYKGTDTKSYAIVADGKVTGWTTDETKATALKSDDNGLFKVAGLDDGTYYLKETKAPTGYNLLTAPVTLVIAAATVNSQNWVGTAADALTALTIKVGSEAIADGNVSTGTVTATIANNAGSTLPSTGGIGTTLFYVIGILLMSGAAVLLVTKKKMANREN
jgi:LPXTG-motif cell wall-anchored protein